MLRPMHSPVRVGPGEQERKHRVTQNSEQSGRGVVVCPPHERDKVQYAEEPFPRRPFKAVKRGEWEPSREWSGVDGRRERDEDRELFAERGAHA